MQRSETVVFEYRPSRLDIIQPTADLGIGEKSRCNHGLVAALPITFGAKGRPMGEIVQEWTITERVRWLGPQRLRQVTAISDIMTTISIRAVRQRAEAAVVGGLG